MMTPFARVLPCLDSNVAQELNNYSHQSEKAKCTFTLENRIAAPLVPHASRSLLPAAIGLGASAL